ncbi:MAG: 1-(5-phosphoribosyl)-5-[(5-phosphoribosylamino)methylideneamino]imidazole-4-carboxamide isomerase [Prevotellaceae bacterium]|jgi:phosphoribosylformimino-5-aminoimidazole carboxamide ribotide isomerase|nr:1-(5-phosphoribosyl)-5-[(5-phosphoribosylamino)methylideneamino]imidazole-4-carboxamide isomerase [Prevotellaceae bacterium]
MIEIIPAIDLIDGKCVRLTKGNYAQKKVYNEDPLEVAKMFENVGIKRLHVVDLDGAKAQHIVNHKALEKIAGKTKLVVDFGGGLKTSDDLRIAFECGAQMVTGGSIAVKNEAGFLSWIAKYGGDKIILGADVNNEKIAVTGWQESTDLDLFPFIKKYADKGITQVICTDISKDGMLEGPNVDLYKKMLEAFPGLHLIASGGVSKLADIEKLAENGLRSVIVGKAIYEHRISMAELKTVAVGSGS